MKKLLLSAFALVALSALSFAQPGTRTSNATASAIIQNASAITHGVSETELNFGGIIPNGDGYIEVTAAGIRGTVDHASVTGSVTAASFTLTGGNNQAYTITLPPNGYTVSNADGKTMILSGWVSNAGTNLSATPVGTFQLKVGATLAFAGDQALGTYTNTTGFVVTAVFQ